MLEDCPTTKHQAVGWVRVIGWNVRYLMSAFNGLMWIDLQLIIISITLHIHSSWSYHTHIACYDWTSAVFRRNRDVVDGAVISTSRSDNARFHPLVILLDTALNGTVDEVQDILPHVCNLIYNVTIYLYLDTWKPVSTTNIKHRPCWLHVLICNWELSSLWHTSSMCRQLIIVKAFSYLKSLIDLLIGNFLGCLYNVFSHNIYM